MAWFRAVSGYLVGQLAFFALIKWIFRAPWGDLIGPYLAFTASITTTLFLFWFVNNKLDSRRATPRQFAVGAASITAFLMLSVNGAWACLGLVLGLIDWQLVGDWTNWAFIVLPLALVSSIVVYRGAYRNAKIRLAKYE
jgi:hypothetical protein